MLVVEKLNDLTNFNQFTNQTRNLPINFINFLKYIASFEFLILADIR